MISVLKRMGANSQKKKSFFRKHTCSPIESTTPLPVLRHKYLSWQKIEGYSTKLARQINFCICSAFFYHEVIKG
jgi:hypothetical protein